VVTTVLIDNQHVVDDAHDNDDGGRTQASKCGVSRCRFALLRNMHTLMEARTLCLRGGRKGDVRKGGSDEEMEGEAR
jgi:hypothetical protein